MNLIESEFLRYLPDVKGSKCQVNSLRQCIEEFLSITQYLKNNILTGPAASSKITTLLHQFILETSSASSASVTLLEKHISCLFVSFPGHLNNPSECKTLLKCLSAAETKNMKNSSSMCNFTLKMHRKI